MLLSKIKYLLAFMFLSMFFYSRAYSSVVLIELKDPSLKNIERIYLSKKFIRLENNKEIHIIDLAKKRISYLNPDNRTFFEQSFHKFNALEGIKKRDNRNTVSQKASTCGILAIESIKRMNLKNKAYSGSLLKYKRSGAKGSITRIGAFDRNLSLLTKSILKNAVARKFLSKYWSCEEIKILEYGFMPLKTGKLSVNNFGE